jgi:hypothetical protein
MLVLALQAVAANLACTVTDTYFDAESQPPGVSVG